MMKELFDTHCHFDSIQDAKEVLPRAYEQGLRYINVIGTDLLTSKQSIEVVGVIDSEKNTLSIDELDIQATIGLHPHEAKHLADQQDGLSILLENNLDAICGIGEAGFDFYYNHSTKQEQINAFAWQIDLAKKYNKTLVIHTRDAWDDTFNLLDEKGWPEKTVFHCFTGGVEQAKYCVENGAYISISGIVTFKNAQDVRDAVSYVSLSNLLSETDAPWLAPVPNRGSRNEPGYVSYVVEEIVKIRELCGDSAASVQDELMANAKQVFR